MGSMRVSFIELGNAVGTTDFGGHWGRSVNVQTLSCLNSLFQAKVYKGTDTCPGSRVVIKRKLKNESLPKSLIILLDEPPRSLQT